MEKASPANFSDLLSPTDDRSLTDNPVLMASLFEMLPQWRTETGTSSVSAEEPFCYCGPEQDLMLSSVQFPDVYNFDEDANSVKAQDEESEEAPLEGRVGRKMHEKERLLHQIPALNSPALNLGELPPFSTFWQVLSRLHAHHTGELREVRTELDGVKEQLSLVLKSLKASKSTVADPEAAPRAQEEKAEQKAEEKEDEEEDEEEDEDENRLKKRPREEHAQHSRAAPASKRMKFKEYIKEVEVNGDDRLLLIRDIVSVYRECKSMRKARARFPQCKPSIRSIGRWNKCFDDNMEPILERKHLLRLQNA